MGFVNSLILSALASQPNLTLIKNQETLLALELDKIEEEREEKKLKKQFVMEAAKIEKARADWYAAHPDGPIRTDLHLDPKRLP